MSLPLSSGASATPRRLGPADAPALAALWHAGAQDSAAVEPCFMPGLTAADYGHQMATELERGGLLAWGLFGPEPAQLLAYLSARVCEPEPEFSRPAWLHLEDLDVHQGARRQGLARRLVEAALAHAREAGLTRVEASWIAADVRAAGFWRALGFADFVMRGGRQP